MTPRQAAEAGDCPRCPYVTPCAPGECKMLNRGCAIPESGDADGREGDAALVETMAELIYLRQYGKIGAIWSANDSKEVWREKARAALKQKAGDKWVSLHEEVCSDARKLAHEIHSDCMAGEDEIAEAIDAGFRFRAAARDAEIATLRAALEVSEAVNKTKTFLIHDVEAVLRTIANGREVQRDGHTEVVDVEDAAEIAAGGLLAIAGVPAAPDPRDEALRIAEDAMRAVLDVFVSGLESDRLCENALASIAKLKEGRTS